MITSFVLTHDRLQIYQTLFFFKEMENNFSLETRSKQVTFLMQFFVYQLFFLTKTVETDFESAVLYLIFTK